MSCDRCGNVNVDRGNCGPCMESIELRAQVTVLKAERDEANELNKQFLAITESMLEAFKAVGIEAPNGRTSAEDILALGAERDNAIAQRDLAQQLHQNAEQEIIRLHAVQVAQQKLLGEVKADIESFRRQLLKT